MNLTTKKFSYIFFFELLFKFKMDKKFTYLKFNDPCIDFLFKKNETCIYNYVVGLSGFNSEVVF